MFKWKEQLSTDIAETGTNTSILIIFLKTQMKTITKSNILYINLIAVNFCGKRVQQMFVQ